MNCALNKKSKTRWNEEDIKSALTLRAVSKKAYNYLRRTKCYPLPSISTLQTWVRTVSCQPGVINRVIAILKFKGMDMSVDEKLVVLSCDEMCISRDVEYDRKSDLIYGPHKYVYVFMARGLISKWKQPVYYNFYIVLTKELLCDIIHSLEEAGYIVVAFVSDKGSSNMKLWKK